MSTFGDMRTRRKPSLVMAEFHTQYPYNQPLYRFTCWRPMDDRAFCAVLVACFRNKPGRRRKAMRWLTDIQSQAPQRRRAA